jgi:hypothetical protein
MSSRRFVSTDDARELVNALADHIAASGENSHVICVAPAVMVDAFCSTADIAPEYFVGVVKQLRNRVEA